MLELVVEKLINSHQTGKFATGALFYDREVELPEAKENAKTIAKAQIEMLKSNMYLLPETEGTDEKFWKNIITKIDNFSWD